MPDSEPASWHSLFPYDPYEAQEQGIERALDVVGDGGYYLLEGACGTGKTAIALTAALQLIDDPTSRFERALVLTSVKQQLEIFQSDLEAINAAAPSEHSSVTLVGKADMCSYVASGGIDERDIYGRCSQLREQTRTLIDDDGRPSEVASAMSLAGGAEAGEHDRPLQTDSADAPYRPGVPEREGTEYCPFYAQYLGDEMGDGTPIEPDGVRRPESLHDTATEFGTCPHAVMADLAEDVDVVIGNYQHAFDPITVTAMTGHLLADSTLVIADEAHGIVEQVRDRLRESVSLRSIDTGIDELRTVERWAKGGPNVRRERRALTREVLEDCDVSVDAIGGAAEFLEALREAVAGTIDNHRSEAEGDRWADRLARDSAGGNQRLDATHLDSVTIPLRDPERAEEDQLTLWADLQGWGGAWDRGSRACQAAAAAIETVAEKLEGDALAGDPTTRSVGRLLGRWNAVDHEEFLRTIQLDPRENRLATPPGDAPWRVAYSAELAIENCLPRRAIAETFSAFGGGILMSATLAPMDVFRTVTGLDLLAGGDVGEEGGSGAASAATQSAATETGRRVESSVFEMGFPEEHRESLAVDLPAFTYSNRGPAGADNEVREAYGRVLVDVAATTPGNVLIAMPSYAEAEWAAEVISASRDVSKDVLCDEPSTNAVTERRKDAFFAGDGKVLTTSLRGTLVEGVDYPGEKLRAAVVCGVPIVNTGSPLPTAIETAYDSRFGSDVGFEYAFTVPAVRKARQALGRVIRGPEDVGVRVLVDERYASTRPWNSVREYLPETEREAFEPTQPNYVADRLAGFWRQHR